MITITFEVPIHELLHLAGFRRQFLVQIFDVFVEIRFLLHA